jgi:hypothetical protein
MLVMAWLSGQARSSIWQQWQHKHFLKQAWLVMLPENDDLRSEIPGPARRRPLGTSRVGLVQQRDLIRHNGQRASNWE